MSEEKTVPAMSDAELERMLAQAGAASVQVPEGFRCGYVAVIGRPNVGKSTLINHLIGEKVSITSKKPQTTRDRVLGVVTEPDAQIVFMDTPGFQTKVGNQLIRRMNRTVRSTLGEVDAIVFVIESLGWKPADLEVLKLLPKDASNVILAINKTDLNKSKDSLLPLMAASMEKFPFAAIVPVSAEKGRQLGDLLGEIKKFLPESVPFFDPDTYTDRSPRFLAAETIREKAFRLLGDELPYGIAVTIDKWQEDEESAEIVATLIVERESHKPIVIGEGGAKLREIGRLARADVAAMLGKRVLLVDADMRKPTQRRLWKVRSTAGLCDFLAKISRLELVKVTDLPLWIVCTGTIPPNPSELLSSERMRRFVAESAKTYDYVIIDTPPINTVADAQIISTYVDGVVLVTKSGVTTTDELSDAKDAVLRAGGNLCGVVLNDMNMKSGKYAYKYKYKYGGKYGYKYSYSDPYEAQ